MKEKTMKENEKKPPGLQLNLFLDELDQIRHRYRIAITDRITPEIEARRIAILVANCYLKHGGNIHQAGFLERKIYEAVKLLDLSCGPIEEEIKAREIDGNFNPLKLCLEGKERYLTTYSPLIYLTIRKLNTTKEKKDERVVGFKDRGLNQRRSIGRVLSNRKIHHKTLEIRKRITLYPVGQKAVRSRAGFYGLGHETKGG